MAANMNKLGSAAADALSRAIVHAMLNAQTVGDVPCYKDKYPGAFKK
jgi:L-aminopeptidase/D-esterase-like protein